MSKEYRLSDNPSPPTDGAKQEESLFFEWNKELYQHVVLIALSSIKSLLPDPCENCRMETAKGKDKRYWMPRQGTKSFSTS